MKYIIHNIIRIAALVLIAALLYSCSSDEAKDPINDQSSHKVLISATGFSASVEPMKKSGASKLTDHISKLHYFAMKPNKGAGGSLMVIKHEEQDYDTHLANFGSIELTLENGDYTIIVIGEQKNEKGAFTKVDYNNTRAFLFYNTSSPVADLFISRQNITINNGDTAANITLDRLVGQLEVKITDPIPAETDRIEITIPNEVGDYYFDNDDMGAYARSRSYSTKINSEDIGSTTFSKKLYILRTGGPIVNVAVRLYDKDNMVIATKSKANVEIRRNEKTTLTVSNLFESEDFGSGNIAVAIDAIWENEPVQEF